MFRKAVLVLLTTSVFITGCASLSQRECMEGDWYSIGLQDGSKGATSSRLEKHQDSCKEYGVTVKKELYESGRNEGLKVYCTPENGFSLGRSGGYYDNVCPPALSPAFVTRYQVGYRIYEYERKISRLYDDNLSIQNSLDNETDEYKRRRLREKLSDNMRERDRLQRELTVLQIRAE